ncbi:hypothetical protein JH268_20615 [Xanthomonas campestris pv. campestris]|nr:hypothetical protein JH285_20635 [Xanthomonas campestris pv. campestris]WDL24094.1 hypothetical protein JH268_20615 [Xanthomonas campestris pv. campestris]WDL27904.1 hypothetical protein JH276_01160 [Xanthomonas campestris pv. campestris]WDL32271.1 hypothetical protein JH297_20665 [Xanthomonas campestris pv. campestris]WDL36075.1 hypothetical protein JH255_01165 [Xanthomonas campestris pv. campestris]
MKREWILQSRETRRRFDNATWVPLRASETHEDGRGDLKDIGYVSEYFGCGSVAFPPQNREEADRFGWGQIGISHSARPYAYEDGHYSPVEEFQYNDKQSIGVELVYEHDQPVVGGRQWMLSPDLIIALRLVKDGNRWVRPEEDFVEVVREKVNKDGSHTSIEIKREFLLDYLAARGLSLRLSYYRQRIENIPSLKGSDYEGLVEIEEQRDGGRFELRLRELENVFGGSWASFRVWRTDVDPDEDAPVMGPEGEDNTESEQRKGYRGGYAGVRVEGEFWRDEWIDHQGRSVRVRGDEDSARPHFIAETDGTRIASRDLNDEDIGRWLWFRPGVVNELLARRGFSLEWYTEQTGAIISTSGYKTHFGVNSVELITVYAHDIAKLPTWEQHVWASHNVAPDGKVSAELLMAQVETQPASTHAFEDLLFETMRLLERSFKKKYGFALFTHEVDEKEAMQIVSRFVSTDRATLFRLAKELVRVFSDRLNVHELRKISTHADRDKLGSNKLLQDLLAQRVGAEKARSVFGVIAGVYDMRVADAHPTSGKVADALTLAGIDTSQSFLRQGQQLIYNFGSTLWLIGKLIFGEDE